MFILVYLILLYFRRVSFIWIFFYNCYYPYYSYYNHPYYMNIWNDVPLGVSVGPVLAHCRDYFISVSGHFSSSSRVFEHRILVVPSSVTPRCSGALLHPAIDSADLAGEWRCNERLGNLLLACVVFLELAVILFVLFFSTLISKIASVFCLALCICALRFHGRQSIPIIVFLWGLLFILRKSEVDSSSPT